MVGLRVVWPSPPPESCIIIPFINMQHITSHSEHLMQLNKIRSLLHSQTTISISTIPSITPSKPDTSPATSPVSPSTSSITSPQ